MNLLFSALDYAIESVREDAELVPFRLALQVDGERRLERFAFESIDASRAAMLSSTQALPGEIVAYALASEGFITIEGYRYSAVLVEAADRSMPLGIHFMQRFRPQRGNLPLVKIGKPAYLGNIPNLFRPWS